VSALIGDSQSIWRRVWGRGGEVEGFVAEEEEERDSRFR